MKENTIELKDLTIGYALKKSLGVVAEGICASVYSGELTCLLGANGVGKSTLLRTLSGFQPSLSGDVYVLGKRVGEYHEKQLAQLIGVVLTEKLDLKNMTVRELISLGRSPYTGFWGRLSIADEALVKRAIGMVKIEHLSHRMVHTLSDGERQKVMIAKTLAQETPVILLDEPTAFLDFPSKVEIIQLLQRLTRETGKTIFLSTHDLDLALQVADKIWLMDKQKGIVTGTPEDLAINGCLNGFFTHKGVAFDHATGLFRVENKSTRQMKMIGEGLLYGMVRKALMRNGISVSKEAESEQWIEVQHHRIILYDANGTSTSVTTIEGLLDKIWMP